jgi:glutamine amidotransferase
VLPGLGWMNADVMRFRPAPHSGLKVPHMAWSNLTIERENPLLPLGSGLQRFYFVHSYHVVCDDPSDAIVSAEYGQRFTAGFQRDNLFGLQFHPEKSHRFGMALLTRFLEL